MSKKDETDIDIPMPKIMSVNKLKVDGLNPNKMTESEIESLKRNFERFGFLVPIITNKDYVIADGEHRMKAAIEIGMSKVSVIALPVKEVDRKILRQVMNKLRGKHDPKLDADEYRFILQETSMEELTDLMSKPEQEILNSLEEKDDSLISEVDKTHERLMTCPKCKHQFKKSDE